ncbi:MFS transporter [Candidatus Uhrbacteria bacterium]|nr:MFS transporter [Candidatus Uhrbacteria bacterium]
MKNIQILHIIAYLKGAYFQTPILSLFFLAQGVPLSVIVASNIFWSVGAFAGEVPTGIFADKFGQKISITLGYLLEAIGILLVVLFPSSVMLVIYFAISGIAYSFLSGSEEALMYESVKKSKKEKYQRVYGKFISNEMIGFMSATALAGFVYAKWGAVAFNPLLLLTAASFLSAAVLSRFLVNEKSALVSDDEGSKMFIILKESFTLIRRNKTVWALTLVSLLTISGEYLMQAVYQPYFSLNGVPAVWLGLVLTIGTIANIVATRYVHKLEDRFTLEKILLFLNLPLGALFVLLGIFTNPVFLIGAYIVMGGLFNLQMPVISDYINARASSHIRTTVLSGVSFVKRFSGIVIAGILTLVVHVYDIQTALITQGIYLMSGIVISYFILVRCGCTHRIHKSSYKIEV